jgi:Domain of unknown function (DUF4868)
MKPQEALTALAEVLKDEPKLQVATIAKGAKKGDPSEARILKLADDAERQFRAIIAGAVQAKLDPLAWTLKKFDPVYKPESGGVEVEWINLNEMAAVSQATDRLDNLSGLAGFDASDSKFLRRLAYWGAAVGNGDDRAYFFRRFSSASELKRKSKAAMVVKGGTFHLVEERIFLFDQAIDCFAYDEYVFVIRKSDFRSIFEQMKAVFEKAKSAASDLHGKLPISNFSDFQDACGSDSRLADKVLAIRKRDYFDQLSFALVEPVIEEFELDISTTKGKGGQIELEFRSAPEERFRILRLCDDDYLRSTMTKRRYEVNSKTDQG